MINAKSWMNPGNVLSENASLKRPNMYCMIPLCELPRIVKYNHRDRKEISGCLGFGDCSENKR